MTSGRWPTMSLMDPDSNSEINTAQLGDRLDSWKEIARYLNRSVRTLYRWEKDEGLPVHRHQHKELGSVFAYKGELDAWLSARSPDAGVPADDHQTAAPSRSTLAVALALMTAAVVVGSTFYISRWRSHREGGQPPVHVAALELISSFAGSHRWPALSPDGRMVAFVSDAAGTPQVWVKNLASGDPIQITFGDRPVVRPRWAARGDRIIFSIQGDGIWSVAALGGDPRRIVERGWNADLSPDGERLTFERSDEVLVAKADGTGITPLTEFPQAVMPYYGDAWPTFSPDGKSIAVFLGEEGRYGDYWVLPSQGGKALRLTTDLAEGGAPAWTPDGNFLVVSSARTGSMNLWRVPVSGGVPEALTTGAGDDLDPVVTPDGRAVLFTNVKRTWALVVHDPKSGVRKTLLEKRTHFAFPRVLAGRRSHRLLREKRARGDASVRDALGCDEHEGGHGWCRGTQHHAAVGSRRPGALFLSDASDADVSARSRLGRRDARSCPLVLESTAGGSCGSSRA